MNAATSKKFQTFNGGTRSASRTRRLYRVTNLATMGTPSGPQLPASDQEPPPPVVPADRLSVGAFSQGEDVGGHPPL